MIQGRDLANQSGLENIKYEPERFAGLIYNSSDNEATGFLFSKAAVLSVGATPVDTSNTVQRMINRLEDLGLRDTVEFDGDPYTAQVSDRI